MSTTDKLTEISQNNATITENEQKVYEAGKKAQYDSFWDLYQNYGDRSMYNYGFGNYGWDNRTFKPKYDLILNYNNSYIFAYSGMSDYKSIFEQQGIKFSTRNAARLNYAFYDCNVTYLPTIDVRGCTSSEGVYNIFHTARKLKSVDKFIMSEQSKWYGQNAFYYCIELEHIIFEGVMPNTMTFKYCSKLDLESLKSLITVLKDYSGTANEYAYTVTLNTACVERLNDDGETAEYTDSEGNVTTMTWVELIDQKKWNLVSAVPE